MIKLPQLDLDRRSQTFDFGIDGEVQHRLDRVLASSSMEAVRSLLDPMGMTVKRSPILHKYLEPHHLRVIFPVVGGEIRLGTVVSIVCLYDCSTETTLYAHHMHAGPNVNPFLKHTQGPMSAPKAQSGVDGTRATVRMLAHKEALWARFLQERDSLGYEAAAHRWLSSYYWALKRLYFCTRCTTCRWGSPFFEGPDITAPAKPATSVSTSAQPRLSKKHVNLLDTILGGEMWAVERDYVQRGGFALSKYPGIITDVGGDNLQLLFPTNARLVEAGTPVAVSMLYSHSRNEPVFAHCLSAGPDAEIQFLLGDEVLGLPMPTGASADVRMKYAERRQQMWTEYWLDELDYGIEIASERWLDRLWLGITEFLGGNEIGATVFEPVSNIESAQKDEDGAKRVQPMPDKDVAATERSLHRRENQTIIPLVTLQNTGAACFAGHAVSQGAPELRATEVSTLMVNLGRRCNQACSHCHVDAGPNRTEQMSRETIELVIAVLQKHRIYTLDVTGGAPEMNPHFRHLVSEAVGLCRRVVDRCNLTILTEPGYEDIPEFLAEQRVEITASLPSYEADDVERQRGKRVFDRSIQALQTLNSLGYGKSGTGRILNLVYNPMGTTLAPPQHGLATQFRRELGEQFGIEFNNLFAMNNLPVNRFLEQLARGEQLESYMEELVGSFNPETVQGLMCRRSLSVAWDGRLYDCDFNQAAGLNMCDGVPNHIRNFDAYVLGRRPINTAAHCFGCAAGYGSSCNGALVNGEIGREPRGKSADDVTASPGNECARSTL